MCERRIRARHDTIILSIYGILHIIYVYKLIEAS